MEDTTMKIHKLRITIDIEIESGKSYSPGLKDLGFFGIDIEVNCEN